MALISTMPNSVNLPFEKMAVTAPIKEGVKVQTTTAQKSEGGMFGWLDTALEKAGEVLGQAANVVSDNFIEGLKDDNSGAASVADTTPVNAVSQLPLKTSFIEDNKTMLVVGGGLLVGLVLLAVIKR